MNNLNDVNQETVKPVDEDIAGLLEPTGTLNLVKDDLKTKFGAIEEKANVYKEKVSDNLSGAAEKVHARSDTAQEYLNQKADIITEFAHQKADTINDLAHTTIGKANELGHRAADALSSSSDYLRNFDFEEARGQIKTTIRQKPELSLAVAGIFGLMLGLMIGRRAR